MASLIHLDTHVVAWLYAGEKKRLTKLAVSRLEADTLAISPMVELELQYLFEIGRASQPGAVVVADLSERIGLGISGADFGRVATAAAQLSWTRDPFDRLIIAQASVDRASLLTGDATIRKHFAGAVWR